MRQLFRKKSEGILGVCETILGLCGAHFGSLLGGYRRKSYSKIAHAKTFFLVQRLAELFLYRHLRILKFFPIKISELIELILSVGFLILKNSSIVKGSIMVYFFRTERKPFESIS